jgi:hypothetical protein
MKHLKKDFQNKFPKWPFQFQKSQSGEDTLLLFLPPDDKDLDPHHIINENLQKVKAELKGYYKEIIPYCQYSSQNEPERVSKENPVQEAPNPFDFEAVKFEAVNNPKFK